MEAMADEVFELMTLASVARARARSGNPEDLTETEFLALDALMPDLSLSVGEIQKRVGVLPAQMSRIIRSLEKKGDESFIECAINASDRRKIDVRISPKGRAAHKAYRATRLRFAKAVLEGLSDEDQGTFMHIVRQVRKSLSERLEHAG
jgi:DNA-binding MarR family transcriptional regulator